MRLTEEIAQIVNLHTLDMYRNNCSPVRCDTARQIDKELHALGRAIIELVEEREAGVTVEPSVTVPVDPAADDHPQDQGAVVAGDELPEYDEQDSTAPVGAFHERFEAFFEQGNTVLELAAAAGLTEWTVRRAMKGESKPQQQTLEQLDKGLKAFGC